MKDIVNNVEDSKREFFRLLLLPERLQLMGFPGKLALTLPESRVVFASGNAYPVPLIIASFFPMLLALAQSGLPFADWPPPAELETEIPRNIPNLLRALASPGKVVDKDKHAMAKVLAKRGERRKRKSCMSDED